MIPHLVFVSIVPWAYTFFTPVENILPVLFCAIKINSCLGFCAIFLMVLTFIFYERYHYSCVKGREAEMRLAGLAIDMSDDFAFRSPRKNWSDYLLFPLAFVMLGSFPAIVSQLGQLVTRSYRYTPSKKPLRTRKADLDDICKFAA
jgi:hypothetical protein